MKKWIQFLLAGIIALIFFELFLRYSPFSYGISPVVYDKDIGMWHKKNFSSVWIKECYHTKFAFDDKGLIQNAYQYATDKKDILVFGDSYIEALMVKNYNVIHNALYREFSGKYNFLNFGLSQTSAVQQLRILQTKVDFNHAKELIQFIKIDTDIYDVDPKNLDPFARPLVFFDFKDLDHFTIIPPRKEDIKEKFRDMLGHFELYVYLKKGIYFIKDKLHNGNDKSSKKRKYKDLTYNWLQIEGAIYQTKKLLASHGIEYKIFLYGENLEFKEKLTNFLQEQQIDYVDLYALAKRKGIVFERFACDGHWTDNTHLNVAKLIKKEGIIR